MKYLFWLIMIVMTVVLNCKCVDKQEIKNWEWAGEKLDGRCPHKAYPIPVTFETDAVDGRKAMASWHKDLGEKVFVENAKGIRFVIATKSNTTHYDENCSPVLTGDGGYAGQSFDHRWAWTEFLGTVGNFNLKVFICLKKYKDAIKLMNTPTANKIKAIGLYGIFKRELGRLLIGPGTPRWYGELMARHQQNNHPTYHTLTLIRETVINPCKRKFGAQ